MTLFLLIVVNVVLLVALAAVWEAWRAARRALPSGREQEPTLRVSCRPADPALARRLVESGLPPTLEVVDPVFGDPAVLVEGRADQVLALRGEVARAAAQEGFRPLRSAPDRLVLRRGLRLLIVDVSAT